MRSHPQAKAIAPVGVIHGLGQCVTVMSLGAGSLAFVNVVKSLEPLFNVVFGGIFMNDWLPWQVSSPPMEAGCPQPNERQRRRRQQWQHQQHRQHRQCSVGLSSSRCSGGGIAPLRSIAASY